MNKENQNLLTQAKKAAIDVCLHNSNGPFLNLPRTAGWGYPEPYTRDLAISSLGFLASGNNILIEKTKLVLEMLAINQTQRGHIPSMVHDGSNLGASDTTPLFLLATSIYREVSGNNEFLQQAVDKALNWMDYQSPSDKYLIAQQPTSDWMDELWVMGFGLYVNTLVYSYLRFYSLDDRANSLHKAMSKFTISGSTHHKYVHDGLSVKNKPYYALWSYKLYSSERFDLLGNSLAIISGLASPSRAEQIISWVEEECLSLRNQGVLNINLPPNFLPFIKPHDPDWRLRYEKFNQPGCYHNGGVWPFICGFYIVALVATGQFQLAEKKLLALAKLVTKGKDSSLTYGFNEWYHGNDGLPMGQDWQTWSASMFLFAMECVNQRKTLFFDKIRTKSHFYAS